MKLTRQLIALFTGLAILSTTAAEKKIILLAGSQSHGPGEHEFNAGCHLLKKCLDTVPGLKTEIHKNGWPTNEEAFEGADAIFIYCDGGGGHPFHKPERRALIEKLMKQGVGLGCAHYAVEIPKGPSGDAFLDWIGGYFETHWSVNPHWIADFESLPKHPITRGVKPFKINDEWYYHMRFREEMKDVTPILSDLPPEKTLSRPDGPHSGNPAVREAVKRGEPQHVMWAAERPDGGRGFGFTGGHFHNNWGDDNFRKIVLNAILWSAKIDIPANGVESTITKKDLQENLDPKK
jgi:type 1 glutamine amidotransferase